MNKQNEGPSETRIASIELPPDGFRLQSGALIPALDIAYETYGPLSEKRDNVVFICHALTGDAHAAGHNELPDPDRPGEVKKIPGWWNDMIGPGKGIDTTHYHVICANILGGCRGTTGPSSFNPHTGKPYGSTFPRISITDIVNVHRLLLTHLGIDRVAALVGGSLGGMQVLEWAIRYPDSVDFCICIASAASLSSQALAFDIIGRSAITSDGSWQQGDYYDTGKTPEKGLALARKIGHITYLSSSMLTKKFGRGRKAASPGRPHAEEHNTGENRFQSDFELERYLAHQGRKFVKRFDANSYLHITEAMDEYDLSEHFGSLEEAFRQIQAKFLVVALSKDWLFTPEQSADIANALLQAGKEVSFCRLYAPHGHDAFLVDIEHLSQVIKAFLPWVEKALPAPSPHAPQEQPDADQTHPARLRTIAAMIRPHSRVLDVGCGNGELLDLLKKELAIQGIGIELDIDNIITVINKGHNVFQTDIDAGLAMIPDQTYDFALLSNTLQVLHKPHIVIRELARVARECIISFPNFGHFSHRIRLLASGRMPKNRVLPYDWYNTPNIHIFTLKDFFALCAMQHLTICDMVCLAEGFLSKSFLKAGLCNLGANRVVVRITQQNGTAGTPPPFCRTKGTTTQ